MFVDYRPFKIMVRQGGKLCPVAVVGEDLFFSRMWAFNGYMMVCQPFARPWTPS